MRIKPKLFDRLRNLLKFSPSGRPPARAEVGAVVYRQSGGNLAFLLLEDKRGSWSIPKDRCLESETEKQAIMRIITENIGPADLKVWQTLGQISLKAKPAATPSGRSQLFLIQAQLPADAATEPSDGKALWLPPSEAAEKIDSAEVAGMVNLAAAKIKRAQV